MRVFLAVFLGFAATAGAIEPPDGVIARATRSDFVFVSWNAVEGAVSYQVFRRSDDAGFSMIGTAATPYYHDETASPGTSYLYRVRAADETSVSVDSEAALATTLIFADPILTSGAIIRATHFTQLGSAVNAARMLAGLEPAVFAPLTPGTTPVQRDHLLDLRTALDAARDTVSLSPLEYTDPAITAGLTPVRVQHVSELRNGVNGPRRPGAVCDPGTGSCDGSAATWCNPDGTAFLNETCDALQGMSCNGETGRCEGACTASSLATISHPSLGCDFYPVVTANVVVSQFTFAAAVSNPNDDAVTVTVTRGANVVASTSVPAKGELYINLPWIASLKGPDNAAIPGSVLEAEGAYRLRATAPVTVAQFNPLAYTSMGQYSYTNDASLLIPAHRWGMEHWVASRAHWDTADFSGFYSITAAENDTEVTIRNTPAAVIKAGGGLTAAGSGTVTLHAGDVLEVVTAAGANDLTGTFVESSKPVQVIGGHQCVQVPVDMSACDHLEESMPPAAALSTSYVVTAPYVPEVGGPKVRRVRILATVDGTALTYDPPQAGAATTLNSGQWFETGNTAVAFSITSTEPILVAEFMTGQDSFGATGDPAMMIATGTDRYQTSHGFLAPTNYELSYVNIVAPAGAVVTLDGVELPGSDFTAVGSSGYSVARKYLPYSPSGRHTIDASHPVGISVYGYGQYTSYWY